jgi:hypothetical protein
MTPTREEYEAAAKAAGIEIASFDYYGVPVLPTPQHDAFPPYWRPLHDGNESQDLQCRIEAQILTTKSQVFASRFIPLTNHVNLASERYDGTLEDRLRALREAIFRLAVEIGRGME